jgi:hypothetical protein
MKALWLLLALLLLTLAPADADKRQRGDERRGFPFSSEEHWDGDRRWTPDRRTRRQWPWPDRFTVDKPGKCEVQYQRVGSNYKCREYRC